MMITAQGLSTEWWPNLSKR